MMEEKLWDLSMEINKLKAENILLKSINDNLIHASHKPVVIQAEGSEDPLVIQTEMLELSIKAGRRLMHDFKHMLNEVPEGSMFKEQFAERGKMWENIFYPDDGMKNYRSRLHQTIMTLEFELERANRLLKENGIDPRPDLPY